MYASCSDKVQLGDFGMMVREDNKGFDNPSVLMNLGTELYCAPVRVFTLRKIKSTL